MIRIVEMRVGRKQRIGQRPSSDRFSLDLYEVPVALPRPPFSFSLLKKKVRSGKLPM
jgi:hypothetical protein